MKLHTFEEEEQNPTIQFLKKAKVVESKFHICFNKKNFITNILDTLHLNNDACNFQWSHQIILYYIL